MRSAWLWFVAPVCGAAGVVMACSDTGNIALPYQDGGPEAATPSDGSTSLDAGSDGDAGVTTDAAGDGEAGPPPPSRLLLTYNGSATSELVAFGLASKKVDGSLTFGGTLGTAYAGPTAPWLLEQEVDVVARLDAQQPWAIDASWNVAMNDLTDAGYAESYSDPQAVVVGAGNKAYVLRYTRNLIGVLDTSQSPDGGVPTGSIDLSSELQAAGDGYVQPVAGVYVASQHRVYVVLGNVNRNNVADDGFVLECADTTPTVVAIDTNSGTLVDLNGSAAGNGWPLAGYDPVLGSGAIAYDPSTGTNGRLLVLEAGCNDLAGDGGVGALVKREVESMNLATGTTTELLDLTAADFPGGLAYIDAHHAIVLFYAAANAWDPTTTTLGVSIANAPQEAVYDGNGNLLGLNTDYEPDGGIAGYDVVSVSVGDGGVTTLGTNPFTLTGGFGPGGIALGPLREPLARGCPRGGRERVRPIVSLAVERRRGRRWRAHRRSRPIERRRRGGCARRRRLLAGRRSRPGKPLRHQRRLVPADGLHGFRWRVDAGRRRGTPRGRRRRPGKHRCRFPRERRQHRRLVRAERDRRRTRTGLHRLREPLRNRRELERPLCRAGRSQRQRRRDQLAHVRVHADPRCVGERRHGDRASVRRLCRMACRLFDAVERHLAPRPDRCGGRCLRSRRHRRHARSLRTHRRSHRGELPGCRRGHAQDQWLRPRRRGDRERAAAVRVYWARVGAAALFVSRAAAAQTEPAEEVTVRGQQAAGNFVSRADERDSPRELTDVASLVEPLPGVHVRRYGADDSFTTLSVRGSSSTEVAILFAGVPLTGGADPILDLASLPLWPGAVARVHRSFAPAALGPGSLGGTLVLDPPKPGAPAATDVWAAVGSFGEARLRTGDVRFLGGGARVATALSASRADDGFSYLDPVASSPGHDVYATRSNAGHAAVDGLVSWALPVHWSPSAPGALTVTTLVQGRRQELPGTILGPTPFALLDSDRELASAELTGALGSGTWIARGWGRREGLELHDAEASPALGPTLANQTILGTGGSAGWRGRPSSTTHLEVRLDGSGERFAPGTVEGAPPPSWRLARVGGCRRGCRLACRCAAYACGFRSRRRLVRRFERWHPLRGSAPHRSRRRRGGVRGG